MVVAETVMVTIVDIGTQQARDGLVTGPLPFGHMAAGYVAVGQVVPGFVPVAHVAVG